ncbi:MAG: hypothetical protein K1Y36_22340 [Blastocatellia bacterium]|nr:hypothetical protein [Blastocatellia bacterium]
MTQPPKNPPKAKKLQEYEKTKPVQLDFFDLLAKNDKPYSRSIELYDFIPKYFWGKADREKMQKSNREVLPSIEREFECRKVGYRMTLFPASLKDRDGVIRDYYPGQREEAVEDALRKLAVDGRSALLDDQVGVVFTLHQLQQELQRVGHSYSKNEIKDALIVCARTNLEIKSQDGTTVLLSNIFETLGLRSFEDWKEQGRDAKCFVRFNALVTASILNMTFRRFNYETAWSYKSVIARQLHKRLSHHYTQAGRDTTYTIRLLTLIQDFGLTRRSQLRDNLREVKAALEEMISKAVIDKFEVEPEVDPNRHNKLVDAKITLWTSYEFNTEILESNRSGKAARLPGSNLSDRR